MPENNLAQLRKTKEELKKANNYLENVFENSPDAIGIVNKHGRFIKWNKMAATLYGYTSEELLGKSTFDLYADKKELKRMLLHLRQEGCVKKWEMQMQRKDGSVVLFEISISLLRDEENRTLGSITVARDLSEIRKLLAELKVSNEQLSREVTVRRDAEEEVRRLSRQNQLILNAVREGIVAVDLLGRAHIINPAGAEMIGYDVDEVIYSDFHELVHHSKQDGARYPVHECPLHKSLSAGITSKERDELFWKKDGASFSVAYSSTPIMDEQGQIVGAVITFRDITGYKRAQEIFNKYRDHLSQSVKNLTNELADLKGQLAEEQEKRKLAEDKMQEILKYKTPPPSP